MVEYKVLVIEKEVLKDGEVISLSEGGGSLESSDGSGTGVGSDGGVPIAVVAGLGAALGLVLIILILTILVFTGKLKMSCGGKKCRKCCQGMRKKKKSPY